jgi:hypothetical protein
MCDYFRVISINSHIYTIDFHALEEHVWITSEENDVF